MVCRLCAFSFLLLRYTWNEQLNDFARIKTNLTSVVDTQYFYNIWHLFDKYTMFFLFFWWGVWGPDLSTVVNTEFISADEMVHMYVCQMHGHISVLKMYCSTDVECLKHCLPTLIISILSAESNYSNSPMGGLTYWYELGVGVYLKAGNHDPLPAAIDSSSRKSIVADLWTIKFWTQSS